MHRLGRMKRGFLAGCVLLGAFVIAGLTHVEADPQAMFIVRPEPRALDAYAPDQLIVAFATTSSQALIEHAVREVGGIRARASAFGGRYLVTLEPGQDVPSALARLRGMREVEYAEPNGIVRAYLTPNDPNYKYQWHMRLIGAERTWDIQTGAASVVVAVLDTGIAYEDFGPYRKAPDWGSTTFVTGYSALNGSSHANDDNFHGTHVASTIAEATNNNIGVAGLCFGCALMPVKVLDNEGLGTYFDVAEGIDYAVNFTQNGQKPVKVINLSLGGEGESTTVTRAIDRAVAQGITVVAAAGNDGSDKVSFPASYASVIAVGAVDGRKQRAPYSNYGSALDVVAPGGDLDRDDDSDGYPDGVLQQTFSPTRAAREGRYDVFGYFFVEGTSEATPHVAAIAALLYNQGIKGPTAIRKAIESTAEDLGAAGRDDQFGYGLVRPAEALKGLGINK
jgi:serine protease